MQQQHLFDPELPTIDVARLLLGWILVRTLPEGEIRARITETEAYLADDPASHTYKGQTIRTEAMFGPAGHAYVYRSYGMHYCLNVVTNVEGVGEGVLIRSAEIIKGRELALKARNGKEPIAEGPGRLTQALSIDATFNSSSLMDGDLRLEPGAPSRNETITVTPRIGISKAVDEPLRFLLTPAPAAD